MFLGSPVKNAIISNNYHLLPTTYSYSLYYSCCYVQYMFLPRQDKRGYIDVVLSLLDAKDHLLYELIPQMVEPHVSKALQEHFGTVENYRACVPFGDKPEDLYLGVFADADFAGCKATMRSTAGGFIALMGPHTFFPLTAVSKRHSAVSHSTSEAEIVSLDLVVREKAIPMLGLWNLVLGDGLKVVVFEDNQSTLKIVKNGKFPKFGHVSKSHGVNVRWLSESLEQETTNFTIATQRQ